MSTSQFFKFRRSPKFSSFLIAGLLVGIILGILFSLNTPQHEDYTALGQTAFFGCLGGVVGSGFGGVIAIIIDQASFSAITTTQNTPPSNKRKP